MVAFFAALMLSSPSIVATINTGLRPCGSAAYGKYLYVDSYGAGTISRIDPSTNKVVKRLKFHERKRRLHVPPAVAPDTVSPLSMTQPMVDRLFWRAGFGPTPADRQK